jgi:hypothetical protein
MDFSLLDSYESPHKKRKISDAPSPVAAQPPTSIFAGPLSTDPTFVPMRIPHLHHAVDQYMNSAEHQDENDEDESAQYSSEKRQDKDENDHYGLGEDEFELISEGSKEDDYVVPSFRASASILDLFNQHFILEPLKGPGSLNHLEPAFRLVLKSSPDTVPSPEGQEASEDEESVQEQIETSRPVLDPIN